MTINQIIYWNGEYYIYIHGNLRPTNLERIENMVKNLGEECRIRPASDEEVKELNR